MKLKLLQLLEELRKKIQTLIASLKRLKRLNRRTEHWSDIIVLLASSRFDENTTTMPRIIGKII